MELGAVDVDNAFTEFPVFNAQPSGVNTVLGDFNGLFVSSIALSKAPPVVSDVEIFLKYDAATRVTYDSGINIHFLHSLGEIQYNIPAVYIGSGSKTNALLSAAGKAVEVYNTGPAPLCPKTAITVIPPLVKPIVPPTVLTSASDGCIPVYPLCTVDRIRFQSEINKLFDIIHVIADCEYSIDDVVTTNSENYIAGLTANIFEALTGNSIWTSMVRAISDHTGTRENEDILRHLLRIFKEHWYPFLHLGSGKDIDEYIFSTNNEMFTSICNAIEQMKESDLGTSVRGLGGVLSPSADEKHVLAFKKLWENRSKIYRSIPAFLNRLNRFTAVECGYIQSSGSESGIISPGGRMLIILPS